MARNQHSKNNNLVKYEDDDVMVVKGGVVVQFEKRNKVVMGTYNSKGTNHDIVFWGNDNNLPDEREMILGDNNIVPQIIRAKRDIIIGGGMYCYKERYERHNGEQKRFIDEQKMPAIFQDFIEESEELYGGIEELSNDFLKHGNYFAELGRHIDGTPKYIKPQLSRHVRAEKQDNTGKVPRYWLYGGWGKVNSTQKLSETKKLVSIPAYDRTKKQPQSLLQGADKLLGGPYYYDPHYAGSHTWMKVANLIPEFHLGNLENGFNIRYLIRVPEDYFLRSLSEEKRKDTDKVRGHIAAAKKQFKDKLNEFLAGAKNAGRGLIVTKHIYKSMQKEWPELDIQPLEVDLKDEAMLKLFESSNQASTSAHGIPPVLAGLATGAKMTSGNEIRNLYNFWQITATPIPRKILLKPWYWAWKGLEIDKIPGNDGVKLGFRNIELTTTDKNPNGTNETIDQQNQQ
jgi:hypothetical protein